MRWPKVWLAAVALAGLLAASAAGAPADRADPGGAGSPAAAEMTRFASVAAQPRGLLSRRELRALTGLERGDPVLPDHLERLEARLEKTGRFAEIEVTLRPVEAPQDDDSPPARWAAIDVALVPREFVRDIKIKGAKEISGSAVERWLDVQPYSPLLGSTVAEAETLIQQRYVESGLPAPAVQGSLSAAGSRGGRVLTLRISEARAARVAAVTYERAGPLGLVRRADAWWRLVGPLVGVRAGQALNGKAIAARARQVERELRSSGYPEAAVRVTIADDDSVSIALEPGTRTRVSFGGVGMLHRMSLKKLWRAQTGAAHGRRAAQLGGKIEAFFRERGYRDVAVTATETETGGARSWRYEVNMGPRYRVRRVELAGAFPEHATAALKSLALHAPRIAGMLRAPYVHAWLEDDRQRLMAYFQEHGYPGAEVTPSVDVEAGSGAPPAGGRTARTRWVDITHHVDAGDHATWTRLDFAGNVTLGAERLQSLAGIVPGADYRNVDLDAARKAITTAYLQEGFADVTVQAEAIAESAAPAGFRAEIAIDEGPRYRFGTVIAAGTFRTRYDTIRRPFQVGEGEPYDPLATARYQQALYDLELFRTVSMKTSRAPGAGEAPPVDVLVEAAEQKNGYAELQALLNTNTGPELGGRIGHRNTTGRGIGLEATGLVGRKRWSVSLGAQRRWLFDVDLTGRGDVYFVEDRTLDSFTTDTAGVKVRLLRRLGTRGSLGFAQAFERVAVFDIAEDVQQEALPQSGKVSAIEPSLGWEARDHPVTPTRGALLGIRGRFSHEVLAASQSFYRVEAEARYYRPANQDVVVALAVRGGQADGIGASELPLAERFFLGGSSTHRGFKENRFGPRTVDGGYIGGTWFALANAEVRFPLWESLHGGVFADSGEVGAAGLGNTGWRTALGVGARYATLAGPLRLDVGFLLDRHPEDPRYVIHVNLGHAF